MKKSLAALAAVALVVFSPGSAYGATSGWLTNNACYNLNVGGCSISTLNAPYAVTATENSYCPGDVGLRTLAVTGVYSSWSYGGYSSRISSNQTITSFNVAH